ncbi:MAG: histidinol-phosphate transaminase [Coriobacteriia bacterium]
MSVDLDDLIRPALADMTPYSPGLRPSQLRERLGADRVVKLSSNEHPEGPVPAALAAIRAAAPHLNRYPDGACTALKERLAARLGIDPAQVVVGAGSNEIERLLGQVLLRPGDQVVYAWPSFVVYPMVANMFEAQHVRVPLRDDAHDLEAMLTAVTDRTRIVFLCNPNNPTGTIFTKAALESFMEAVPESAVVVLDEAYFEFVSDDDYPDGMTFFDGERPVVITRTFSKIYSLAGLRVGYAAAPEPLARAIDKVREPFNVNMLAQAAAFHSLDSDAEVARRRRETAKLREALSAHLRSLGFEVPPSHANFVFAKSERAPEVFDALIERGVITRAIGPGALRIGIGDADEMRYVHEVLSDVVASLGGV